MKISNLKILFMIYMVINTTTLIAQENRSYVRKQIPLSPIESKSELGSIINQSQISKTYFNEHGLPEQQIEVMQSAGRKDIVKFHTYTEFGDQAKYYLPYTSGENIGMYRENPKQKCKDFYNSQGNIANDRHPYTTAMLENSPMRRVRVQGAPGEDWQWGFNQVGETQFKKYEYLANDTNRQVIRWYVDANSNLKAYANPFEPGSLYKTRFINENNDISYVYTNKSGQKVLSETIDHGQSLRTYYVYDNRGMLRYVLPPKFIDQLASSLQPNQSGINGLAYIYNYDKQNHLVEKKLPGQNWNYFVYDKKDRLVMAQDGNMRADNQWAFIKYDEQNRPVLSGLTVQTGNVNDIRSYFANQTGSMYEKTDASQTWGYTLNNSYPPEIVVLESELLSVNYFDNYDFPHAGIALFGFDTINNISNYSDNDNGNGYFDRVRGLQTGSAVKVLDGTGTSWVRAISYYDDYYRVIQSITENYPQGHNLASVQYDFSGRMLQSLLVHNGFENEIITKTYEYGHAGRLLSVAQDIEGDANGEIILAKYEYNELGQVINQKLHNKADNSYLQKVDYTYNIRGWLEKINDPTSIQADGDLFAMQLGYNDEITGLGNTARYNGDISAMVWAVNYDNISYNETKQKAYTYSYDNLNRLKSADYFEEQAGTLTNVSPFDLVKVNYDENGNIYELKRNGRDGWAIDDLSYNYSGNFLFNVEESANDIPSGGTLSMLSTGSSQRQQDANGNLIESTGRHDVSISYNYLNLPYEIITCGDTINYIYDATGNKRAECLSGTQNIEKYYMGSFQYTNQDLEYIHNSYGRIRLMGNEYHYDYFLSDHLGNVRVVFTDDGTGSAELLQASSYYPFGMQFNNAPEYQAESNNYLYNGKELQRYGNLNTYDYGWRQYDAALGRWNVQDPLAEGFSSYSPYNYVMNSPMNYIDPNGMYPDSWQRPGETAVAYNIRMNSPELYNMMYSDGGGGAGGSSWSYVVNSVLSGNFSNISAGHYTSDGSYYSLDQITINAISKNGWTLNNPGSGHFNKWFDHYEVEITSVSASVDGGRDWQSDAISQTNGMLLTTDKLFNGAGYAAGAVGAIQIGMLEYRMSLPLSAKIGSFSKFSTTYKGLGYASRTLGRIGYAGAGVGFIMDINAVRTGDISIGRFGYRTGSLGTAIGTGAAIGGPWGAAAGAFIGGASIAGEFIYDNYLAPIGQEIQYQIWNFENAIKNGWYPGR